MSDRRPLSTYPTAQAWLTQFDAIDRPAVETMLDAMLLLNEEQVSTALRSQLYALAESFEWIDDRQEFEHRARIHPPCERVWQRE